MALSVVTIAPKLDLTTRARVSEDLGSAYAAADAALVDRLIREASAAIVSYCRRPFARESYTETLPGFGDIHLQLARTPIVTVSAVSRDGTAYTDYSIADRNRGWLYRQDGWDWTVQVYPGLSDGGRFLDVGNPLPRQEEPLWSVSYVAGYVLPSQNVVSATTISAAAADNSFNDSASGFPNLLKAGDVIETSGFTDAANNGRHVVTGTPTTAKIVVSSTLVTEAAGTARTVLVQSLPEDIEKACIEAVKSWYALRSVDSSIVERQAGPMRLRYSEPQDVGGRGLPPGCIGLLRPYVRLASAA